MKFQFNIKIEPFVTHQRNQSLNEKSTYSSSSVQTQDVLCEHNRNFSVCAMCGNKTMRRMFLGVESNLLLPAGSKSGSKKISSSQERIQKREVRIFSQPDPF